MPIPSGSPRSIKFHMWIILNAAIALYQFRSRGWVSALFYVILVLYSICVTYGPSILRHRRKTGSLADIHASENSIS
jgi:hypothetical protein